MRRHRAQLRVRLELRLLEQEENRICLRKFGGRAEASVLGVVRVLHRLEDFVDDPILERAGAPDDARTGALASFQDPIRDLRTVRLVVGGHAPERVGHLVGRQVGRAGEDVA